VLFPTQLLLDPPVIGDIRRLIDKKGRDLKEHVIEYPIRSFNDLISMIARTDLIVATRFHGVVIPYALNKSVLGIAYAAKTYDLMKQTGQGEYTIDIKGCSLMDMQKCFVSLESKKEDNEEKIRKQLLTYREALEHQYQEVFRLLER
jgi:polysaccharide pyruvyl transferase WcaK-like protein